MVARAGTATVQVH